MLFKVLNNCRTEIIIIINQQGSRWTLQATLMDGRLDFLNWTIKPDQMQTLVPFFGLIFLALFDVAVYPLLRMVGIRKSLQKLTLSGLLSCTAFIFTAILQYKIFVSLVLRSNFYYNIISIKTIKFLKGKYHCNTVRRRTSSHLQCVWLQRIHTSVVVIRGSYQSTWNDQCQPYSSCWKRKYSRYHITVRHCMYFYTWKIRIRY